MKCRRMAWERHSKRMREIRKFPHDFLENLKE
jgi:hypothetical protein